MKMFKQNGRISLSSSFKTRNFAVHQLAISSKLKADVAGYHEPTSFPEIKRIPSKMVPGHG